MNEIDAVSIPGYQILSRIMTGGMATVYVAEQLKLGSRRVAVKIFHSRASDRERGDQDRTDHTKARYKRFAQEALIARNLQHPHIVQIFDYGSTDEFQFLVMEYLAHGDLKQHIRAGLQPLRALHILQQVASALALLHQNGIVHRDIKPANILFREPDHAVLADFGIARSIDQNTQLTNAGFVLGTPSYMSPEQINGGDISAKTDMYALGVLFYEMLTGKLPYRGDSVQSVATQHLMAPVPPLPLEVRKLQPLLNRLMAKKASERMATGSELLQALAQVDSSRGFAVKPPSFVQLHVRKIIAIAALMLCSVAVTWAGISQLPYWLDLASGDQHGTAEPVSEIRSAPMPKQDRANVLSTAGDTAPVEEAKLQPVVSTLPATATSSVATSTSMASASPASNFDEQLKLKSKSSPRRKSAVPALRAAESAMKPVISEDIVAPAPVVADDSKIKERNSIAEQPAAYAVEVTQAPSSPVEAPAAQPASLPAAPEAAAPAASTKRPKPPPVISYF